jgi:hypothetical protein
MAKPPHGTLTQIEKDRLQFLKARFDAAHADGQSALKRGDFRAAEKALRVQRGVIEQQRELILFRIHRAKSLGRTTPAPRATDRVAWTLVKLDCHVELVLRQHRFGTEIRCMHKRTVLWTELIMFGADHDDAVQRAVADARAAWLAKGWNEP